ncbi:MAG: hypothetical protein N2C14_02400 [Planctomycetales bacterium]
MLSMAFRTAEEASGRRAVDLRRLRKSHLDIAAVGRCEKTQFSAKRLRPNHHQIAFVEFPFSKNALAVDEYAVLAVQVANEGTVFPDEQNAMTFADQRIADHEVAIGLPANVEYLFADGDFFATLDVKEKRHGVQPQLSETNVHIPNGNSQ